MTTFDLVLSDTETVVLNQITEGNYSSEYFTRTSTAEYRMKVRHTKEKATGALPALDRHNIELTVRTFPSSTLPLGATNSVYAVIRSNPNSDGTDAIKLAVGLSNALFTNAAGLVGWSSTLV